MDENEILSRIDARGRAAAAGVHDALDGAPVPLFDPEVHPVALDGAAPRRRMHVRWMSAAGILVLALVAAVAVLAVDRDGDGGPTDRVDTGAPPRRFAAGHLPDGFVVAGVSDALASSPSEGMSGPLVLYGPDPSRPELAMAVVRAGEEDQEDDPEGEVVTLGDRRLVLVPAPGFPALFGTVEVDGRQVMVIGRDRAVVEAAATTVAVAADDRPDLDPSTLPDGWEELGQLVGIEAAFGGPVVSFRAEGSGSWMATYMGEDEDVMLTVTSTAGGALDVAAGRLAASDAEDVEVRGHPALVTRLGIEETAEPGSSRTVDAWSVAWEERPGEVLRVGGYGVGRDDVLAVAEGVRPVEADEWDELTREALRATLRGGEGAVELGEGTFSDGTPWLAYVDEDGLQPGWDEQAGTGSVGGPIPSDGEPAVPDPRMEVRTPARSSMGVSSASGGDLAGTDPFLDGLYVEDGETLAWAYGLVAAEVATIELVGPEGEVLARAEILRAGGHHGFLLEVPTDVVQLPGLEGPSPSGPSTTALPDGDSATGETQTAAPTTALYGHAQEEPGFVLVARAADGTELGRQPLP